MVSAKIITPVRDALTMGIREYLDRMGMPSRVYEPDSDVGRHVRAMFSPDATYPLVYAHNRTPIEATSVRDVARSIYGVPDDFTVEEVVDVAGHGSTQRRRRRRRPRR